MSRKASCNCGDCKRCKNRIYMRRWYQSKTPEERRAWVARRDPENVKARERQRTKKRRLDPKVKARKRVSNAIANGKLARGACEFSEGCEGPIEAHHDDYSKPLDVRWLCRLHHRQVEGR